MVNGTSTSNMPTQEANPDILKSIEISIDCTTKTCIEKETTVPKIVVTSENEKEKDTKINSVNQTTKTQTVKREIRCNHILVFLSNSL